MSKIIAFYMNQINVRGTSVAVYDYADYNEKLLKNKSLIILPESTLSKCDKEGLVLFQRRFPIRIWNDFSSEKKQEYLDRLLTIEKCDVLYNLKYGKNDGVIGNKVKNVVHCVFDMSEPHGDIYAGVSKSLARKFLSSLYVPHMVSITPDFSLKSLREELGIPQNGIVFGRYGGEDTFNLQFCMNVIEKILSERENVYFLFANTIPFCIHPRIFYLKKFSEINFKKKFINSCDVHLECGNLGHSFGLAIAEFSVHNLPIIAYRPGKESLWNTEHIEILGDKGIYFSDEKEFHEILRRFDPKNYIGKDLNCYRSFSPNIVMQKFSEVFLN